MGKLLLGTRHPQKECFTSEGTALLIEMGGRIHATRTPHPQLRRNQKNRGRGAMRVELLLQYRQVRGIAIRNWNPLGHEHR